VTTNHEDMIRTLLVHVQYETAAGGVWRGYGGGSQAHTKFHELYWGIKVHVTHPIYDMMLHQPGVPDER
jgi:hypothetical protein